MIERMNFFDYQLLLGIINPERPSFCIEDYILDIVIGGDCSDGVFISINGIILIFFPKPLLISEFIFGCIAFERL